jgi:hypothetical protein
VKHAEFLDAVGRLERELGALIDKAHASTAPTVEWVAMLTWASCARGSLMSLVELGLPEEHTPLATSPAPAPAAEDDRLECLLCTHLREPDSKFCERHRGGLPVAEDYKGG